MFVSPARCCLRLFVKLLLDYLNEMAYPAELAGLSYSITNCQARNRCVAVLEHCFRNRCVAVLEICFAKDHNSSLAFCMGLCLCPVSLRWRC